MRLIVALLFALIPTGALALDDVMRACAVTTSSSVCIIAEQARVQLELRNAGATNVAYCSTTCPATTTNGFPLPVSGANPWKEVGNEAASTQVCCITAANTTTVVWREVGRVLTPTPTPTPAPTPTPTP